MLCTSFIYQLRATSVKTVDSGLHFIFSLLFYFILFYFLFLEQLRLGVISHAVTSVTT